MNPTNPQKLISTFLILATAVSSSVLIFATNGNSKVIPTDKNGGGENLPTNAFANEEIKQIAGFSTYNTLAVKNGGTQNNLTDYFAEKLLGQLAEDNSDNSLANSGSGVAFAMPDMTKGFNYFLKDPSVALISSVNPKDIKIKSNAGQADYEKYLTEVASIIETASSDYQSRLKSYSRQNVSEATLGSLNFILSDAIAKLYNVKVPAAAADYHTALIKSIKTHSGLTGVSDDPLRSYFYAKQYDNITAAEKKMVADASSNLNKTLSLLYPNKKGNFFAQYFGINKANAQWVTFDFITEIESTITTILSGESVYSDILNYVLKIATEVLKDQLIHRLVQQTINWANNGFNGKPQYVENFGKLLSDVAENAGNRVLSDALKNLTGDGSCPRLVPAIQVAFAGDTSISAGSTGGYSCTIDQLGANLDAFSRSFSDGGWIAYRNVITKPQGNFMSAYIDISDNIAQKQQDESTKKQQEVQTGGGFLNMQKCKNPDTATGADAAQFATMEEAKSSLGTDFVSATCAGGTCTSVTWCQEGGWETTTPAQIASQATKDALSKSPIDRIVNANDLTGLVSALVNSALTKIVTLAQDGLAGLVNKKLEDQSGSVADACAGAEDPVKCKQDLDNTTKGVDEQKASKVSSDLKKMMSAYSDIAQIENEIISGGSQAKFYLEQASSTCSATFISSVDPDTTDAQFYVQQNYDYVVGKINEASSTVPEIVTADTGIIALLQKLDNAITAKDLDALLSFNFGITPTGDTNDKKVSDFVSKLSDQMKSSTSAFGRKFSTIYDLPKTKGDLSAASKKIIGDECSITQIASKIKPDPNSCRLSAAKADCKFPGQ